MTDNRKGGIAFIAGMVGTIVTMAFHPTGHDMLAPGKFQSVALLNTAVHSLALLCVPVLFLGGLVLTRRLMSPDRYSVVALVFYGFSLVAVMSAAVASGLIAPGLIKLIMDADGASNTSVSQAWRVAFNYNGFINQAFAKVFVVSSCIAMLFWSLAMQRQNIWNSVAVYGICLAPIAILALVSGHLSLGVHGFGMVVVLQAIWFISVGVLLCSARENATAHAAAS
jgi:hypothetical protein